MRQVVIYREADGWWIAEVPSLPGCHSQGRTREEALQNAREAAELWIDAMRDLGEPIPADNGSIEIADLPEIAA